MRACRTGTALRARSTCAWRWRRRVTRRTATPRSWTSPGAHVFMFSRVQTIYINMLFCLMC